VLDRDGMVCRRCARSLLHLRASKHHRRPKGMGGGDPIYYDRPDNIVLVCGSGTTGCHGWIHAHPTHSYATGWLIRHGSDEEPSEIPLTDVGGREFFLTEEGGIRYLPRPRTRQTSDD
jgi:hypothetical protein